MPSIALICVLVAFAVRYRRGRRPHTEDAQELAPSRHAQLVFTLVPAAAAQTTTSTDGVLKLDQFVVDSARDTNAASIAINEQRFANNLKTVLSTDALGDVIQNNLGEFVKFLPGVDVGTDQMNSVQIGLRGLPSTYTNIALDGEDVNAAGSAGPSARQSRSRSAAASPSVLVAFITDLLRSRPGCTPPVRGPRRVPPWPVPFVVTPCARSRP